MIEPPMTQMTQICCWPGRACLHRSAPGRSAL